MEKSKLEKILSILAKDKILQQEAKKNFTNNLWWPSTVKDKRLRLIIAGLSTRISYSMIETYKKVINNIISIGYDNLASLNDKEKLVMIKPLGLSTTRLNYINSMIKFISSHSDLNNLKDDAFIKLINDEVVGASYKVAQCCLLYYKGYPCSIMPVDSGMKDVLLPCLGYPKQKSGIGHEVARLLLEDDVSRIDKKQFIKENNLNITEESFNWWAHLSLIYYKRQHCNKKDTDCSLHNNGINLKETCLEK